MQSIRDHGKGNKGPKEIVGATAQASRLRGLLTTLSNPSPSHPVLIDLVRLLAREAAAAWLASENGTDPNPENTNDQSQDV